MRFSNFQLTLLLVATFSGSPAFASEWGDLITQARSASAGDSRKAIELYEKALSCLNETKEPDLRVELTFKELSTLLLSSSRTDEARTSLLKLRKRQQDGFAAPIEIYDTLRMLFQIDIQTGRFDAALSYARDMLTQAQQIRGFDGTDRTISALELLALAMFSQVKLDSLQQIIDQQSVQLSNRQMANQQHARLLVLQARAKIFAGKNEESKDLGNQALKLVGDDSAVRLDALDCLAECCLFLKDYQKSEQYTRESLGLMQNKKLNSSWCNSLRSRLRLAQLSCLQGRNSQVGLELYATVNAAVGAKALGLLETEFLNRANQIGQLQDAGRERQFINAATNLNQTCPEFAQAIKAKTPTLQ